MRPPCLLPRLLRSQLTPRSSRRTLLTLAVETSCDDTAVAILEKHPNNSATLHFHQKITSDNREFQGISPIVAHHSHQKRLSSLINLALQSLPIQDPAHAQIHNTLLIKDHEDPDGEAVARRKPDMVAVTRGPGMRANLITGMDTTKGLAVAWQVPFLGVNHMQAHALTPRLVSALKNQREEAKSELLGWKLPEKGWDISPGFPFLSLLVSGGNTMLVHSKGLCDHEILARTVDIAVGDLMDKCARDILPEGILKEAPTVSYGPILELYAFPDAAVTGDWDYTPPEEKGLMRRRMPQSSKDSTSLRENLKDWAITPPFSKGTSKNVGVLPTMFSFSGIGSNVKAFVKETIGLQDIDRRVIAREAMRVAFEHLTSRVLMALKKQGVQDIKTLVVAGGVASNQYLKHILRSVLDRTGHQDIELVFPPPRLCTDNAVMIAWTAIEMFEQGYTTSLDVKSIAKWDIDPTSKDGGILGASGWIKEESEEVEELEMENLKDAEESNDMDVMGWQATNQRGDDMDGYRRSWKRR